MSLATVTAALAVDQTIADPPAAAPPADGAPLPHAATLKPFYRRLEPGARVMWCACGLSRTQPWCDGSHGDTGFRPVPWRCGPLASDVLLCGCKQTRTPPFCDGSHNNLPGAAVADDPDSPSNRALPEIAPGADGRTRFANGVMIAHTARLPVQRHGPLAIATVLGRADGALWQSHLQLTLAAGAAGPVLSAGPQAHAILMVLSGQGSVRIGDRPFGVAPDTGVSIRPGETFALTAAAAAPLVVNAALSPLVDALGIGGAASAFDAAWPKRCVAVDPVARQTMGDRFFQMLVDRRVGSDLATQFIGEIPPGKAALHRHLYEESLIVLRGQGQLWTDRERAPLATGDVFFLPSKQIHSVQVTSPGGMMLAGVIYPGDNPSINF